jgi:hypothetical protein
MRLEVQSGATWQYHLDQNEADILLGLLKQFPFNEMEPAEISREGPDNQAEERRKLLAESMAEHRKELKKLGLRLLAADKWEQRENGCRLTLDEGSREVLLQLLNDIRMGGWHALGQPELEDFFPATKQELWQYNLMELAGYFEAHLLEPGE